jgi:hypothetical protein
MRAKGPTGVLFMLIGGLLAASAIWQLGRDPQWGEQVPTALIGLALASFGFSMFDQARKEARRQSD